MELGQDARRQRIVAAIDRSADFDVGFDRIETLVLQGIGLDLFEKTNAATLVIRHIDDNAEWGLRDDFQRSLKLLIAVAAQRMENIPRHAS